MKRRISRRGSIIIECLIAGVLSLLVGAALMVLVRSIYLTQSVAIGQNLSYEDARQSLNVLSDHLRDAQAFETSTSPATYAAISAPSATSVTVYALNSSGTADGSTARYWLDTTTTPHTLKCTQTIISPSSTTTTVLITGVTALTLTYYLAPGGAYNASGTWATTASPSAPTAAEIPNVGAVSVSVTVTINGYTTTLVGLTRLRNSPYRS